MHFQQFGFQQFPGFQLFDSSKNFLSSTQLDSYYNSKRQEKKKTYCIAAVRLVAEIRM